MNRLDDYYPPTPNLTGTVLVASPRLSHTPMAQAMVLVVQDSDTGVFGVRINNTASTEQAVAFEKSSHLFSQRDALMIGGPLDGPVMALHQNESIAEMQIRDGVFVSCSQEALEMLVGGDETPDYLSGSEDVYFGDQEDDHQKSDDENYLQDRRFDSLENGASDTGDFQLGLDDGIISPYRIVLGIAGWQRSQINAEIDAGLWYPIQGEPDIVFEATKSMWIKGMRRYGDDVLWDVTGLIARGIDCRLN